MTFCVDVIPLKNSDLITEREISSNKNVFEDPIPVVRDISEISR